MKDNNATPAPSQPAGAREFCWECRDWLGELTLTTAQAAFHELHTLRQQTAAKDAALETFRCQLRDALKLRTNVMWFGTGLLTAAGAVVERAEAAERERDSLREALATIRDRSGCICDHSDADCCAKVGVECDGCLAALTLAALKAGKEGQQ